MTQDESFEVLTRLAKLPAFQLCIAVAAALHEKQQAGLNFDAELEELRRMPNPRQLEAEVIAELEREKAAREEQE